MAKAGNAMVAPFTGAWIEIPPWPECKYFQLVAPFTGAWIEIPPTAKGIDEAAVAPFTGAWIEMVCLSAFPNLLSPKSLPSRERGLK